MPSKRELLKETVSAFLDGRMGFEPFEAEYRQRYWDESSTEFQLRDEIDLFGDIIERLDWTGRHPPKRDRDDGWIDHGQFRDWLSKRLAGAI